MRSRFRYPKALAKHIYVVALCFPHSFNSIDQKPNFSRYVWLKPYSSLKNYVLKLQHITSLITVTSVLLKFFWLVSFGLSWILQFHSFPFLCCDC
jgi:hypothetical protein